MGSATICFVLSGLSALGTLSLWNTGSPILLVASGIGSTIVWLLGGMVFVWLAKIHAAIEDNTHHVVTLLDSINRNGQALNIKLGANVQRPVEEPISPRRKVEASEEAVTAPPAMFRRTKLP